MEVMLNGQMTQLPDHVVFVSDMLNHYQIIDKVVVVEVNGEILTSMVHQSTRLSDKDRIEIVHFVGGG
jgi:sulfur carrier protein